MNWDSQLNRAKKAKTGPYDISIRCATPIRGSASRAGFSLLEALIALSVMSIFGLGLATMLSNQHRSLRQISQKQEIIEYKNQLMNVLNNPDVCTWQLQGRTINVTSSPSPTILSFTRFHSGVNNSSPRIAQVGQPISSDPDAVTIHSISFRQARPTGVPGQYMGTFMVAFQPSSALLNLRPIEISRTVIAHAGPANAKVIEACDSGLKPLSVGSSISCDSVFSEGGTVPNPPCAVMSASGELQDCSPGWAKNNCHGASGRDCCVKFDPNALP